MLSFCTVHLCPPNGNPQPVHVYLQIIKTNHFLLTVCPNNSEKAGKDVINFLTSDHVESTSLVSWLKFRMNFTSGVFSSKHSRLKLKLKNIPIAWLNSLHKHIRDLSCFVPILGANTLTPYIIILGLRQNANSVCQ